MRAPGATLQAGAETIYAGTSGFSYPKWRGRFYPERLPTRQMLSHYARHLNGVELNGSFYRLPEPPALTGWAAQVGPEFLFCCKASRGLTYSAAAFDKEGLAAVLSERLAGLRDRRGPLLLQWPPTKGRDEGLLDRLLAALGRPVAVEFRHESWFCPPVYRVLRGNGAALVRTDAAEWPLGPVVETAPFAYLRLRRPYDAAGLRRWRGEIRALEQALPEVHVYFRHFAEAPEWAEEMLR
jgi:uncharacterized protein YecE (DUF72 family)